MALTGTGPALGDKIAAIITASDAPDAQKAAIKRLWEAIGTEIVDHVLANARVKEGISVSTTGSETAQTGQTTAPGELE